MKNAKRKIILSIQKMLSSISPTLCSKWIYKRTQGKKLDLKNPKLFNEKLMWLKLNKYNNNNLVTECADKYLVRNYIKRCGCDELLNEVIGVYNSVEEINFEDLPNKFVLKCNHAAGYNIICKDKNTLDIVQTKRKLKKWLNDDYWKQYAEVNYKNIPKKIICEKYLENKNKTDLEDYKFYCFNGKAEFVMICIGRNSSEKTQYYFMDKEWKIMKINAYGTNAPENFTIDKPDNIQEMFEYAEKLSTPFPFVRVDFYDVDGKIYFGELTFTPAGCVDNKYIGNAPKILGDMLEL